MESTGSRKLCSNAPSKHFVYFFDSETGFYMRTGVLDESVKDTGVDPFMASFPHLLDVGIMGHCYLGKDGLCRAAGVQCYQSGSSKSAPNMSVEDFSSIVSQCRHMTNQIALGGRGDPNMHECFGEILRLCRENDIVPTTPRRAIASRTNRSRSRKRIAAQSRSASITRRIR